MHNKCTFLEEKCVFFFSICTSVSILHMLFFHFPLFLDDMKKVSVKSPCSVTAFQVDSYSFPNAVCHPIMRLSG